MVRAFLWSGTAVLPLPAGRARLTVALVRIDGRIVAVHGVGVGGYESLATP